MPVISGGVADAHCIQGIGAGFVPANLVTRLMDSVEMVSSDEASRWARRLATEERIFGGISTGASVAVAARLAAERRNRGKVIVTFACSAKERYLSTPLYQLVGMPEISQPLGLETYASEFSL